ncbi:hypothetical protein QEG98_10055 [Myxococcus sp. MxC21-1]|uniref:hypothetical protein n=1 Tax=Myxococcus sp. MxC21-1 TaxID=3041439 RepID=UPI00293137EE|nr:hypothetical protein [Myxococcus sp. MxC21-1]WNZ63999.1 hypothetical protein QEG98_10055 [Myxococcus sp. MxC21-1]
MRGIGERTSAGVVLDDAEIGRLKQEVLELDADPSIFHFNVGRATGYVQPKEREAGPGRIHVRGDVLPLEGAEHPRSSMSTRAVLAHEYWGHAQYPRTRLEPGAWNDEFRASYTAAAKAPNLTFRERQDLMRDAVKRAEEANRSIKSNALMRYFFSNGYADPPAWWTPPKGFKQPGEE